MIPINHCDGGQLVQRKHTFDGFPFDDPEIGQAIAHAIALLLRNDTPESISLPNSADIDTTREDNAP